MYVTLGCVCHRALELLFALGALNGQCGLTSPLGYHLAEFPVEPRVAAMLLSSLKMECSEEALTIAAMTSVKSIFAGGLENRRKVCRVSSSRCECLFALSPPVLTPTVRGDPAVRPSAPRVCCR